MEKLAIWLVVAVFLCILLSIVINYTVYLFWEGGLKIISNLLLIKIERLKYIFISRVSKYINGFDELKTKIIKYSKRESQLFYAALKKWHSRLSYGILFFVGKQKN